jgi:hypothetical protein
MGMLLSFLSLQVCTRKSGKKTPLLLARCQELKRREQPPAGATHAFSQWTVPGDDRNCPAVGELGNLFDNPIVRRRGIGDAKTRVGAGDVGSLTFFVGSSIKDDPDFRVIGVRKLFYSIDKEALRRLFPPLGAVAPYEDACVQDIEAIDNEERSEGLGT